LKAPVQEQRPVGARPLGVVVLALLHVVIAVLGILAVAGIHAAQPASGRAILIEALGDLAPAYGLLSVAGVLIAVGLWRLDRWGWYGAMAWTGIGLAWQILLYLNGHQSYLYMVLYVVAAFYLNQREVKRLFQSESVRLVPVELERDSPGRD
jgi:hypothetical protein